MIIQYGIEYDVILPVNIIFVSGVSGEPRFDGSLHRKKLHGCVSNTGPFVFISGCTWLSWPNA
jgi:hypothetical protein